MYFFMLSQVAESKLYRRYEAVAIPVNFRDNLFFLLADFHELIQVQKYFDWFGSIVRVDLLGFSHQINKFAHNPVIMFAYLVMFLFHFANCNLY